MDINNRVNNVLDSAKESVLNIISELEDELETLKEDNESLDAHNTEYQIQGTAYLCKGLTKSCIIIAEDEVDAKIQAFKLGIVCNCYEIIDTNSINRAFIIEQ